MQSCKETLMLTEQQTKTELPMENTNKLLLINMLQKVLLAL